MTEAELKAAIASFILDGANPAREADTRHEFDGRIWPQITGAKWFAARPMPSEAENA